MSTCTDRTARFFDPLATTLFGKTRQVVLALFLGSPERTFYLRQVVRLTRRSPSGLSNGAIPAKHVLSSSLPVGMQKSDRIPM